MNRTNQVREYFEKMERGTPGECARALGISAAVAWRCVQTLRRKGRLKKVPSMRGLYKYVQLPAEECGKAAELQDKLWRAMRFSRSFLVFDAAQISGARPDYTRKYIAFLLKQGYLEKIGRRSKAVIYRRTAGAPYETPRMRNRAAGLRKNRGQGLIDMGWELMRAIREGELEAAHGLATEIRGKIGGRGHGISRKDTEKKEKGERSKVKTKCRCGGNCIPKTGMK